MHWVGAHSDEQWRRREQSEARRRKQKAPAVAPEPASPIGMKGNGGSDVDFLAMIPMLRQQLQARLQSGEVRQERRASYERLIDKIEAVVRERSDPNRSLQDLANSLERMRAPMAEFQQSYVAPGAADRLSSLAQDARARGLAQRIAAMKAYLFQEVAVAPAGVTGTRVGELVADVTRAHVEVASLADGI